MDAQVIALFCQTLVPDVWLPLPAEVRQLQALVRRLDVLMQMHQQEVTRLQSGGYPEAVAICIESVIGHLDEQIKSLKVVSDPKNEWVTQQI